MLTYLLLALSITGVDHYTVKENRNGAIMSYQGATIYIGRNCDVQSPQLGKGHWEWANGGWSILFRNGREFGFARQDAPFYAPRCRS